MISPVGVVSTFAGTGMAGSTDGTGIAASFLRPGYAAFDSSGNLFVSDSGNHKIRRVTPAGAVSTFAGSGTPGSDDGTGTAASFSNPMGLAFDSSGNLFVADNRNHKIRKITPAGVVTTFAGSGMSGSDEGTGTAASFNEPLDLAFDTSGNLFVADQYNYRIRRITPAGIVSTFAGSGAPGSVDGAGVAASFSLPTGLAFDASGNLFVGDAGDAPRIRKITGAGMVSSFTGSGSPGNEDGPAGSASLGTITDLAFDASGNLFLADSSNSTLRRATPAGLVTTYAGSGIAGLADGAGVAASFNMPSGLVFDATGKLFVMDSLNHLLRKVVPE